MLYGGELGGGADEYKWNLEIEMEKKKPIQPGTLPLQWETKTGSVLHCGLLNNNA